MPGSFPVYVPFALIHDTNGDTYRLTADFDPAQHVLSVLPDTDGSAALCTSAGKILTEGEFDTELLAVLGFADGARIPLERVLIGDQMVGFSVPEPLRPGEVYIAKTQFAAADETVHKGTDGVDRARFAVHPTEFMPCLGPGAILSSRHGDTPVEWLSPGDQLLTRDNGFATVRWIGRYPLTRQHMAERPGLGMVVVAPDAFGTGQPNHPLAVSKPQRALVGGAALELHFSTLEAVCPIGGLTDGQKIWQAPAEDVTLSCILFDRHELIMANGLWLESLFIADGERRTLAGRPDGIVHPATVRPCLHQTEAQLLAKLNAVEQPCVDSTAFVA